MSPLDRLAACAGKTLARIEMMFPGLDDDALEPEAALVEVEAESEVHEPSIIKSPSDWQEIVAGRVVDSLGIDERDAVWKSVVGTLWRWDENRWWHSEVPNIWTAAPHDYWPRSTGPYIAVDTEAPELGWHGWAVPAILEVLAEHSPFQLCSNGTGITCDCQCGEQLIHSWDDHVAPLIAERIACDPERALNALRNDRLHQ